MKKILSDVVEFALKNLDIENVEVEISRPKEKDLQILYLLLNRFQYYSYHNYPFLLKPDLNYQTNNAFAYNKWFKRV